MGCTVRGRSLRTGRRSRHLSKPPSPTSPNPNPNPNPNLNLNLYTESHLHSILLTKLHHLYTQALSHLTSLGHSHALALRAILSSGHIHGSMDAFSNIVHNALSFINSPPPSPPSFTFPNLARLEEHSLTTMISHLQQIRPQFTKRDAMCCLLMSDLQVRKNDQDQDQDMESVMKSLESMSIAEETDDHKKEMIFDLIRQIQELEVQVKERRDWAQEKALQAARRVSTDLAELNALRAEREENQKVEREVGEDSTMKRLVEIEAVLNKAKGEDDRVKDVVKRLETENMEIRAEMEACKLSASESTRMCLEVAKREKKWLKRMLAWEKQKEKLEEEIGEERKKIGQMQEDFDEVQNSQKEIEIKWRQEIKSKVLAISQVEEERRAKEAVDISTKRKHEALRQKIEIDFQRQKDDVKRLEEELSRLKASAELAQPSGPASNTLPSGETDASRVSAGERNSGRECTVCRKDEVSVVFLPCTHQVICTRCNEEHEKRGKASCPSCNARIKQRVRVYGPSS